MLVFELVRRRLDQIAKEIENTFVDLDRKVTKATASTLAVDRISLTGKPPKVKIKTEFEKAFKKYLAKTI